MAVALAGFVVLALVAAWLGAAWRGLVMARDGAEETWAAIDRHLAERHRLVPDLDAAVRAAVPDEASATLERLDTARAAALTARTPFERADAERRLVTALVLTAALAERHAVLGGSATFVDVQAQLAAVEDDLGAARRLYNADVRLYLRRRRRRPAAWLTGFGEFPERPYYELDHTRAQPPTALRLVA
jgi:LemA protein